MSIRTVHKIHLERVGYAGAGLGWLVYGIGCIAALVAWPFIRIAAGADDLAALLWGEE